MKLKYIAEKSDDGKQVKYILKQKLHLSERLVKKLKYSGRILRNSQPVRVNELVVENDIIEAVVDFEEECEEVFPESIDIEILYEDDYLIILNKQPGIVVHPTSSHPSGTIANAVMHHLTSKGVKKKVRPVSRLDRDTSGVIIFAKNQFIQEALIRQMNNKTFYKEYLGVVYGIMEIEKGTINLPIERKPGSIMLRHVSNTGAESVTHYEVLEHLHNATLLKFHLETGRTHQIRVHCQAIGHPLIGDSLYSDEALSSSSASCFLQPESALIRRQALHSFRVRFLHPYLNSEMDISAPVPADIEKLLEILRNNA